MSLIVMPLTVIADIHVVPDRIELERPIEPTREQPGGSRLELHRDDKAPERFVIQETWADRESWQVNTNTDHLAVTEGAVDELGVRELTRIG